MIGATSIQQTRKQHFKHLFESEYIRICVQNISAPNNLFEYLFTRSFAQQIYLDIRLSKNKMFMDNWLLHATVYPCLRPDTSTKQHTSTACDGPPLSSMFLSKTYTLFKSGKECLCITCLTAIFL